MEITSVFHEKIALTPKDIRQEIYSIDDILEKKFATKIENKCSQNGFVLPNTIKILSRSMGYVEKGRFTGNIIFHIQAEAGVLNPPDGTQLEGDVMRKNKMGMYVNYKDAIRVILPRDLHIGNDRFEAIQVGDRVRVEIKKSRFQVNDAYILSVGLFKEKIGSGVAFISPTAEGAADAEEEEADAAAAAADAATAPAAVDIEDEEEEIANVEDEEDADLVEE
jgi:DNA-directed RNA polymerase subunit E'/Rpb7